MAAVLRARPAAGDLQYLSSHLTGTNAGQLPGNIVVQRRTGVSYQHPASRLVKGYAGTQGSRPDWEHSGVHY